MELVNCRYISASSYLPHYLIGNDKLNILECLWNVGFYSNVYQTFSSLLILSKHGIVPDKISFEHGFHHFKFEQNQDVYPCYYKIDNDYNNLPLYEDTYIPDVNITKYDTGKYNFINFTKILNKFFVPSDDILQIQNLLIQKYNIDFDNTISVLYRGTDKYTEMSLASPEKYMEIVKDLLEKNPSMKVLLQTDQTQVVEYFMSTLGDKCFFFGENLTTTSNISLHYIAKNNNMDIIKISQTLDASIRCISKCKYVITSSGNVGMFVSLYRGSNENVYKFDECGDLIKL